MQSRGYSVLLIVEPFFMPAILILNIHADSSRKLKSHKVKIFRHIM